MMNVIPYEEAVETLSRAFGGAIGTISLPVTECAGFIAAEDVYAPEDVPPFDRSVVDGYAASYKDTSAASPSVPSILILKGESRMGEATGEVLSSGECFYVPTGGMLPAGADAVLMIEDSEKVNDEIYFSRTLHKGENVIFKGADVAKGDVVLKKGERLGAAVIGALCSVGISSVKVYRKLDYFVISTGDELVPANAECPICKIRDTNTAILAAELSEIGSVVGTALVTDDYEALSRSMRAALETFAGMAVPAGKAVCVGDMLELGDASDAQHRAVGEASGNGPWRLLAGVGTAARALLEGAVAAGYPASQTVWFATVDEAAEALPLLLRPGETLLLKGSRGMRLERVLEALRR